MADVSLWSEDDPRTRLAELTADTSDPAKESPLRRDMRSLGILLGRVLVEQEGEEFFEIVERLRRLLIQHRDQAGSGSSRNFDSGLMAQAHEVVRGLSVEDAYRVTKAFAVYFELTNLAETNHRKRRRRAARLQAGRSPIEGSFRGTLFRFRAAGMPLHEVLGGLKKICVTPVFTAHPTEITRHTIRLKRRRIARLLERLDHVLLSQADALEYEAEILQEITALWQTDEVRLKKPTVRDEIHMGLDYFPMVLFETVPRLYAELEESLADLYGAKAGEARLPELLHFGSWIGGAVQAADDLLLHEQQVDHAQLDVDFERVVNVGDYRPAALGDERHDARDEVASADTHGRYDLVAHPAPGFLLDEGERLGDRCRSVGGTEAHGRLELQRFGIDGEDPLRPGEAGALNGGRTKATHPDDRDVLAWVHLGSVHR